MNLVAVPVHSHDYLNKLAEYGKVHPLSAKKELKSGDTILYLGSFFCRDMTLIFARNYERELLKHKVI